MRVLVIANPKATTASRRSRAALLQMLADLGPAADGEDLDVMVMDTTHRGHAIELAAAARAEGRDLVITLGGDGTINEAVNGLLAAGISEDVPALAVIPNGSANVLARALGLPNDPIAASAAVTEALKQRRTRTIGLGHADGRYFTLNAGVGLDAEVVRAVELRRRSGQRATPMLYIRTAAREFFFSSDRRRPALTLLRPGQAPVSRLFLAIVSNTSPWTYLGPRPVNPNPLASFDTGLDVFAVRRLRATSTLRVLRQMMTDLSGPPKGRYVHGVHDLGEFTLRSQRPIAFQLDGDYIGEREEMTFRAVPDALRVVV